MKLTTSQAAAILAKRGIRTNSRNSPDSQTVGGWCREGKLIAERTSQGWRIDESDLATFNPPTPRIGRPKLPPLETKPDPQDGVCAAVDCERRTKFKNSRFCVKHERQYYRERGSKVNEKISKALEVAESWATVDGDHHKQWVIDQMIRALLGDDYDEWVRQYNSNEEAEDTWDVGIAP